MARTTIHVVQDGSLLYLMIDRDIRYWTASIRVHALSRHAPERAREAFARMFAAEFPEAEIKWVRSIWSTDGSADTICTLSFRNDLAFRSGEAH
jgi:hypothetical protein